MDENANGTLDDQEVTGTKYVCHGAAGATGATGANGSPGATGAAAHNSLIDISTFVGASGSCDNGGLTVRVGLDDGGTSDTADDGTLDSSEVDTTSVVCDGADGAPGADGGSGGGVTSFGYSFELATLADASVSGGADVPFSNDGPLASIVHPPGSVFIVPNPGTYLINYSVTYSAGAGAQLGIAVNGNVDPSSVVLFENAAGTVSGSVELTLAPADLVTLRNASAVTFTMELAPAVGAQLDFVQLD